VHTCFNEIGRIDGTITTTNKAAAGILPNCQKLENKYWNAPAAAAAVAGLRNSGLVMLTILN
jgi:hypothetical protein